MYKNRLLKLSEKGKFISGIFNYCDRWCEKCNYTANCLNYQMMNERFSKRQGEDTKEDWLNDVHESFALAHKMIDDYIQKENIKLDPKDIDEIGKREKKIFNFLIRFIGIKQSSKAKITSYL